ncbi:MAG: DNA polymerase III subunit alpha [Propionibacteriaceae bacterium]|nr:DNA polymerase III subunit alpha [Propionibacteriaceae bacterium]
MPTASFVHLHVHTEYSMLDGAAKIAELFAEAERLGMPAVAMTDHGNMFGAYEFFAAAQESAVKPIIGIEAYIAPSSRFKRVQEFWGAGRRELEDPDAEGTKDVAGGGRYLHMTLLARNAVGLRNLFRLSSLASLEGYYMKPRMDIELLSQHAEGIIATTGCPSGAVQTHLRLGQYDEALAAAAQCRDIFGADNYFVELMDHGIAIERNARDGLLKIAKALELPLLATNDSHYVREDQADAHDSLLCVGVGRNKADEKRFRFSGSGYFLRSGEQMRDLFADLPEACDATLGIAERVEPYDEVFALVDRMPQFDVPAGETQESWLRVKLAEGLRQRYGAEPPAAVLERVETELQVIEPLGFASYFLIVSDITRFARDKGIRVGPGRGSATGSMVAYLTRITELDPIEHGLIFERFLNPDRVSPPDVDLDVDDRRRDEIVQYIADTYGADYTAQVNTFNKIKAKAAVKDSSRILGYPFSMGERIVKAMPADVQGKGVSLADVFNPDHDRYGEGAEFRALYETDPDVKRVVETGRGLEGLTRGTGVHAAAVVMSSAPLLDLIPVHKRDDGVRITGFSFPQCEAMGLMKMDVLGLRNLGILDHALEVIKANRGVDIDLLTLPLDDASTYELLARGDTLGVFQLDGGPMRALLRSMAPTRFEDIAAVLALYRPGPMAANAHIRYAERKNGREPIVPIHPELAEALEPILGTTYHLMVYQEQLMATARELAGYTLGGADLLRRAMGKKKQEAIDKEYGNFTRGMAERGYSAAAAQALWDVMAPFAGYAFNKSHTAGYGIVSYWTAYLKANYPAEYMAALLESVKGNKDKSAVYLGEARRMGVRILPPDINESEAMFTPTADGVRFGLTAIRNVGQGVVDGITQARHEQGRFKDFFDFLNKVPVSVCNKRVVESLIKAGAFDSLGHPRRALLEAHERAVDQVVDLKRNQAIGQDDLFGLGAAASPAALPGGVLPDVQEWDKTVKLAFEREMLGLYVSEHPLDGLENLIAARRSHSIAAILENQPAEEIDIAGMVTEVTRRQTKKGESWAQVVIEDLEASITVMVFPKVYAKWSFALVPDTVLRVSGRARGRDDGPAEFIATDVEPLDVTGASSDTTVSLSVPVNQVTRSLLDGLKRVLKDHPGPCEVLFQLIEPRQTKTYLLGDKVGPSGALMADLKALLGHRRVTLGKPQ